MQSHNDYQRIEPREPQRMTPATFNFVMENVRKQMQSTGRGGAGVPPISGFRDITTLPVQNDTGSNQGMLAVVGLDNILISPTANLNGFCNEPVFSGVIPESPTYSNNWGVMLEACPTGRIAQTAVSGVVPVQVYVNNYMDEYCELAGAKTVGGVTTYLGSGSSGSKILWFDTSSSGDNGTIAWAIVRLGGGGEPLTPRILYDDVAPGDTDRYAWPVAADMTADTTADKVKIQNTFPGTFRGYGSNHGTGWDTTNAAKVWTTIDAAGNEQIVEAGWGRLIVLTKHYIPNGSGSDSYGIGTTDVPTGYLSADVTHAEKEFNTIQSGAIWAGKQCIATDDDNIFDAPFHSILIGKVDAEISPLSAGSMSIYWDGRDSGLNVIVVNSADRPVASGTFIGVIWDAPVGSFQWTILPSGPSASGNDELVKITSDDTTSDYLADKIVGDLKWTDKEVKTAEDGSQTLEIKHIAEATVADDLLDTICKPTLELTDNTDGTKKLTLHTKPLQRDTNKHILGEADEAVPPPSVTLKDEKVSVSSGDTTGYLADKIVGDGTWTATETVGSAAPYQERVKHIASATVGANLKDEICKPTITGTTQEDGTIKVELHTKPLQRDTNNHILGEADETSPASTFSIPKANDELVSVDGSDTPGYLGAKVEGDGTWIDTQIDTLAGKLKIIQTGPGPSNTTLSYDPNLQIGFDDESTPPMLNLTYQKPDLDLHGNVRGALTQTPTLGAGVALSWVTVYYSVGSGTNTITLKKMDVLCFGSRENTEEDTLLTYKVCTPPS